MPVQIFDENTAVKYPLSDFHESVVPNDILVDLSVSAPKILLQGSSSAPDAGTRPVWMSSSYEPATPVILTSDTVGETSRVFLTSLVKRSGVLFVSFEAYPGTPVCHLSVTSPEAFKIYRMSSLTGVVAWIVFGPGISRDFDYQDLTVPVDARCLLMDTAPTRTLMVNGVEYEAPRVLTIRFNDAFLQSGNEISRNDAFFNDVQYSLREDIPSRPDRVYDIGGAPPDADGNVTVVEFHQGSSSSSDVSIPIGDQALTDGLYGDTLGLIINNLVWQGCEDWYAEFRRKFKLGIGCEGDLSTTGGVELPMDYVYTGCCSQQSSSSSSSVSSSSSSSSSSTDLVACPGTCMAEYIHYSYGGCEQCRIELVAYLRSLHSSSMSDAALFDLTCVSQGHPGGAGSCDGGISCVEGTPGYETRCGICCNNDCQLCTDPEGAVVGTRGVVYSPLGVSAATSLAMAECATFDGACANGHAVGCATGGCMVLRSWGDDAAGFAEWTLCCLP